MTAFCRNGGSGGWIALIVYAGISSIGAVFSGIQVCLIVGVFWLPLWRGRVCE